MNLSFKKDFWLFIFTGIVLLEIFSFISFLYPIFNYIIFTLIILLVLFASLKDISFGLMISFLELLIGSQGYLFSFACSGFSISLRIGIWLVVMSVFCLKFLQQPKLFINKIKVFREFKYVYGFIFLIVIFGIAQGFLHNNDTANIFFDVNNWFYFLLILPWLFFKSEYINNLWNIFTVAIGWIFVKTLFFLYVFSHQFELLSNLLYTWTRDYRIGEITFVGGNFWRIFMQNQNMALMLCLGLVVWLWNKNKNIKQSIRENKIIWLLLFASSVILLLSYSRSFWLGGLLALISYIFYLIVAKKFSFKLFFKNTFLLIGVGLSSVLFIYAVFNFPLPYIEPHMGNIIADRIKNMSAEPAGGSRLALLAPLADKIKGNWLFGAGFGSTVTYFSNDPRIVSRTAGGSGEVTTYAFEWGYLDLWLKLGLFGLIVYFYLFYKIFLVAMRSRNIFFIASMFALSAILFTHITTPYLNHPLGIGIILVLTYLFSQYETA